MFKEKKLYISISAHTGSSGGGANTFAWNFSRYLNSKGIATTDSLFRASHAIIIANKVNKFALKIAKAQGCFILHRLDEDFGTEVSLTQKHEQIIQINKLANVTVFQSNFVKEQLNALTKGSTFLEITMFQLRKILTPISQNILEQKQIASILSNVDTQIQKEKLHKSNLERLKKGLMQKLLTGQIRVKVR